MCERDNDRRIQYLIRRVGSYVKVVVKGGERENEYKRKSEIDVCVCPVGIGQRVLAHT